MTRHVPLGRSLRQNIETWPRRVLASPYFIDHAAVERDWQLDDGWRARFQHPEPIPAHIPPPTHRQEAA